MGNVSTDRRRLEKKEQGSATHNSPFRFVEMEADPKAGQAVDSLREIQSDCDSTRAGDRASMAKTAREDTGRCRLEIRP